MKIALTILFIIIIAVLTCGCTTPTPVAVQPTAQPTTFQITAIPNITGTWSGTMQGYEKNTGFTDYGNETMTMFVTGQQGRLFLRSLHVDVERHRSDRRFCRRYRTRRQDIINGGGRRRVFFRDHIGK